MIIIAEYDNEKQAKAVWATLSRGWLYRNKIFLSIAATKPDEIGFVIKTGARIMEYLGGGEFKVVKKGGKFNREIVIEKGFKG